MDCLGPIPVQTLTTHETEVKQAIMQDITRTTTSQASASINPSTTSHCSHMLTPSVLDSLFTIFPTILPHKSAATPRFLLGDADGANDDHLPQGLEVRYQRRQIFGLLFERSTIRQATRNSVLKFQLLISCELGGSLGCTAC